MRTLLIAASCGIAGGAFMPELLPVPLLGVLLVVALLLLTRPRWRPAGALLLGVFWASGYGHLGKAQQLSPVLEGKPVWVTGTVAGLPDTTAVAQRFELQVDTIAQAETGTGVSPGELRIRLNWYQFERLVSPGERWRLKVKLKRPHGFANPGGFDYEGWLFRQGIGATGYVRQSPANTLLEPAGSRHWLDQWRYRLRGLLREQLKGWTEAGLLLALGMGERDGIPAGQWQLLADTGTTHLFVISGLHVGFVALCAYGLFFNLSRLLLLGPPHIAAQRMGACAAVLMSLFYAGVAGFSLPTQRALIMLVVLLAGRLLARPVSLWFCFWVALCLVLLLDPLAPRSAGFWLSFGAVASLLYAFAWRTRQRSFWWRWMRPQWIIFVAFVPVLLFYFQQVSLVSPLANVVAVPLVGLLMVPACLLAVALAAIGQVCDWPWGLALAEPVFAFTAQGLGLMLTGLQWLAGLPGSQVQHAIGPLALLTALAGAVLVLAPAGLPGRWLGVLALLPLLSGAGKGPSHGDFEIVVLDVGQGLAVVVRTAEHRLVYDVGAKFSPRFDAASAVIVPYLRSEGIDRLDRVVISHSDSDHAGALADLLEAIAVTDVIAPDEVEIAPDISRSGCRRRHWQWDGVDFALLRAAPQSQNNNNRSCVLSIRNGRVGVLLLGDIEREAEAALIGKAAPLQADVLVAPHHGSATSSTGAFIEQVAPAYVIFSAGYRNRFKHPHPDVVARYKAHGVRPYYTAKGGAIYIRSSQLSAGKTPQRYRDLHRRYWF